MKPYEESKDLLEEQKLTTPAIPPRGGSLAGVHYATLYEACQRKFHMKFNLGVDERCVDKALIFGSAIHEAKAVFYQSGDSDQSIARGIQECDDRKDEFYSPDEWEFSRGRVAPLMRKWFTTFGYNDLEKYNILAVEEEIRLPVPFTPGFIHTQRHDAVLEDRQTSNVYTFDTKTASSSLDFTLNSTRMSDQVTSYNWGGTEIFGKMYKGFIIDVQYWSSRSANPGTIKCARSEPITRSAHELRVFQAQIGGLFNEIQAKERALALGTPAPFLYRRNSYYCMAFFRKCSYADVCPLADRDIPRHLPDHLIISKEKKAIDGMTYDNIYFGEGPY